MSWREDMASGGSAEDRNDEARRILFDMGLKDASFEQSKEEDFVSSLVDRFEQYGTKAIVSSKQLFWLRDLKDKYL